MPCQADYTSSQEAVKLINSGDRVFIHSVAAAPQPLINAMTARAPELEDIEIVHLHTEGDAPYVKPEYSATFHTNALFVGAGVVTTRAHMHYVVTEFGVTNLYGKNLRERAKALIEITHPNHRESLEKTVRERFNHF